MLIEENQKAKMSRMYRTWNQNVAVKRCGVCVCVCNADKFVSTRGRHVIQARTGFPRKTGPDSSKTSYFGVSSGGRFARARLDFMNLRTATNTFEL